MANLVYDRDKWFLSLLLLGLFCCGLSPGVLAQEAGAKAPEAQTLDPSTKDEISAAPAKVDVKPMARDEEIRKRLQSVLDATDWFTEPRVRVKEGVAFLNGKVESAELKKWAGDLASNTQDVVAVVNRMEIPEAPVWDFGPTWSGLSVLWRDFIRSLPFFAFGFLILVLSVGAAILATRGSRVFLRERIGAKLLRNVIARGAGVLVFPDGIPVTLFERKGADAKDSAAMQTPDADRAIVGQELSPEVEHDEVAAVSTKAEAGLYSEAVVIEEQARQAQPLKAGENLLPSAPGPTPSETQTNEARP